MKRLLHISLLVFVGLTLGQRLTISTPDSLKSNNQYFKFHDPKHSLKNQNKKDAKIAIIFATNDPFSKTKYLK